MTMKEVIGQTLEDRVAEIGGALLQRIGREVERLATDAGAEVDDLFANLLREINGDLKRDEAEKEKGRE
jgi:hypothetical protein